MGSHDPCLRHLSETHENQPEMIGLIPFFAGFVTLVFGIGFYFALQEFKGIEPDPEEVNEKVFEDQ
jgi:hypothetical protein